MEFADQVLTSSTTSALSPLNLIEQRSVLSCPSAQFHSEIQVLFNKTLAKTNSTFMFLFFSLGAQAPFTFHKIQN